MQLHDSQSSYENVTPSSGTSPLASYQEVPPSFPGLQLNIRIMCLLCTPWPTYRSTYRPTVDRRIGWHIGQVSIDMSVDISVECGSICRSRCVARYIGRHIGRASVDMSTDTRPIYRSRGAQNTHDPNILLFRIAYKRGKSVNTKKNWPLFACKTANSCNNSYC